MSIAEKNTFSIICWSLATALYIIVAIAAALTESKMGMPKHYFIIPIVSMAILLIRYLWFFWSEHRYHYSKIETLITASVPRTSISANWKRMVRERCNSVCTYCNRRGTVSRDPDGKSWNYDHCVPISKGGITHPHNLTLSCSACNLQKSDKTTFEYLNYLRRKHT